MSETEQEPSRWTLDNPLVRAGIVSLIVLGVAIAAKEFKDQSAVDEEAERDAITELLERHQAALDEKLDKAPDREAFLNALPTHSGWFPAMAPCGTQRFDAGPATGAWEMLFVPPEADKPHMMRYQIAFLRDPATKNMSWIARRDGDCDGLHEVHTLRLKGGIEGALTRQRVEVQNLGE